MPEIVSRDIEGLRGYDILRRSLGDEIEFTTIIWFEDEKCIEGFVGLDSTIAHIPDSARKVLSRWDERAVHVEQIERVSI